MAQTFLFGGHIDSAENAQQEEDGSPSNEPNAERLRSHSAIPRARNVLRMGWVVSLRICSKKSSEEELCCAASETQLKGKASKQSCIHGRNRRRLFWRHRPADRWRMYCRKVWRRFRSTWVRRKSRTSPLRLSISSTEKARKRRCQGYNSLEEAAAAA